VASNLDTNLDTNLGGVPFFLPDTAILAGLSIDNGRWPEYFIGTLGEVALQRLRWMLVVFLMGAAVCCCALPGVDLPETAFNEADLPVNLAIPAPPRVQDAAPAAVPVAVLPTLPFDCAECVASPAMPLPATPATQFHFHSHSLQVLLCTFLI
jgi:hypothetical protein